MLAPKPMTEATQRRPGVLQAAQDTGDREDHEHGRDAPAEIRR